MDKKNATELNELRFDEEKSFKYGYTCYDCVYLDKYDRNKWGEPYCRAYGRYIDNTDAGDYCPKRS